MLDLRDQEQPLDELLALSKCHIALPAAWTDLFAKTGPLPVVASDLRQFPRFYGRGRAALQYRQTLPALPREPAWYCIYTLDVSRAGLGFLHSQQLYPGEQMRVAFSDRVHRSIEIVCCRMIQDRCYAVGARFLQPTATA